MIPIVGKIAGSAAWKTTKALAGAVPPIVWQILLLLILILVARWYWIGVGEDRGVAACQEEHRTAQERADARQATAIAKRDDKATGIATDSHKAAAKAVAETKESTDAREERIAAVPVAGVCLFPDGLPDLTPAVDAANAARRNPVP